MQKLDINPRAKALIFDLDGTLVDTMPVHYKAYQKVLGKYGINYSPKMFQDLAGIPVVETIKKINEAYGTNLDPETIANKKETEYERNMHEAKAIEPVVAIVKKYYGKLPMAVGTGSGKHIAMKTLKNAGLTDYFNIVVTSDDIINSKPHPETFLNCAKQMAVSPVFCEVFEDGELGIKAAKSGEMMATLITDYL